MMGWGREQSLLADGWQVVMRFVLMRKKKMVLEKVSCCLGVSGWHSQQRNKKLDLFLLLMN